jgi:hypothetical protein
MILARGGPIPLASDRYVIRMKLDTNCFVGSSGTDANHRFVIVRGVGLTKSQCSYSAILILQVYVDIGNVEAVFFKKQCVD